MPRLTVGLALLVVLGPGVAAAAADQPGREARTAYTAPGGVDGVATVSAGGQGSVFGEATLPIRRGERTVTLSVTDDSSAAVAADVVQVLDEETGRYVTLGVVCGPAPRSFALRGSTGVIAVRPLVSAACGQSPSVPVGGTVVARFR